MQRLIELWNETPDFTFLQKLGSNDQTEFCCLRFLFVMDYPLGLEFLRLSLEELRTPAKLRC